MRNVVLAFGVLISWNCLAAEDCGKIKNANFETRTGIEMESGNVYLIEGAAAAAATVVAQSNELEICVYGISGVQATGMRINP